MVIIMPVIDTLFVCFVLLIISEDGFSEENVENVWTLVWEFNVDVVAVDVVAENVVAVAAVAFAVVALAIVAVEDVDVVANVVAVAVVAVADDVKCPHRTCTIPSSSPTIKQN